MNARKDLIGLPEKPCTYNVFECPILLSVHLQSHTSNCCCKNENVSSSDFDKYHWFLKECETVQ